ncbi:MAG: glycosyl transferase group 1 [Frankiales bacterium]|nr:glycosyl transferase group 1 [Frankiales bacterium]
MSAWPKTARRSKLGPPRVLVVTPVFPPALGGIETLTAGIVDRLRPWPVEVVTLAEPGSAAWDARSSLDIHRASNEPRGGRRAISKLNALALRRALSFRPTVVLSMHVRCGWSAWAIRLLTRARWVQYYHAKEIAAFPSSARLSARGADRNIVVSSYTKQLLQAAGRPELRSQIIPPAVTIADVAGLAGRAPAMSVALQESATRDADPLLLTVSRMADPYKGHDVIIKALPLILAEFPRTRWLVAGDGSNRADLERDVDDAGLADHVEFLGFVDDEQRQALFTTADLFVLPSRVPRDHPGGEGFGIVYLEAAANGLPVVAGNLGGAVDAVADNRTGLLVDPTDPRAVAEAILRLARDPAERKSLAAQGPAWAATFSWQRLMNDLRPTLANTPVTAGQDARRD